MKNPNYLQNHWESFLDRVVPNNALGIQRRQMRLAFFAGAQALFSTMLGTLEDTGNPDDVTDLDLQVMTWLNEEMKQFREDLNYGKE